MVSSLMPAGKTVPTRSFARLYSGHAIDCLLPTSRSQAKPKADFVLREVRLFPGNFGREKAERATRSLVFLSNATDVRVAAVRSKYFPNVL
jgi:hypothetical protein